MNTGTIVDSKNVIDTTSRDDKSKFVNIGDAKGEIFFMSQIYLPEIEKV
jgi:hypothetical protein